MPRIRLIHWKEEECEARAGAVRQLGYTVDAGRLASASMKEFRESAPDAVLIDLSRLPAHGLEVGVFLRRSKSTRLIPLIFVEGAPEKLARVKEALPDARFTTYEKLGPVLEDVLASPPREAFVPASAAPAPLAKKLGLKEGQPTGLVNAPDGFESVIPNAVRNPRGKVALTLWFIESQKALEKALPAIRRKAEEGGVWIIWPKTTTNRKPDVNGNSVRQTALAMGLVDFKICAVDETWSGMRFTVRRPAAAAKPAPAPRETPTPPRPTRSSKRGS